MQIYDQRVLRRQRLRLLPLEDRLAPATFTVNSVLDDGSGSGNSGTLRYCIGQANSTPGDDTINISVNGAITLASGQLTLSDTTGQTTITGPGAGLLTIDGNLASRVFQVNSGVTASISGVTVTRGKVLGASGDGGGINNSGTLTVTNSTVSGNSVGNAGGGIYNNSGTLTVTNSVISGNSASGVNGAGGGIYNNSGTLTLSNCTVTANSAGAGGGVINEGILTITNSAITNNTAGIGGGIFIDGGTTITTSSVSGNRSVGCGGGLYIREAPVTLADSTISGNTMTGDTLTGAGIYNAGMLTITHCSITQNVATRWNGGGIANRVAATLNISDSIIAGNSTGPDNGGGGILNSGTATLTDCTIAGNSAGNGGGIANGSNAANGNTAMTITNCTISGNHGGDEGGGIFNFGAADSTCELTATNLTISGNTAVDAGGGVINDQSAATSVTATFMNSTVTANVVTLGEAGGLFTDIHGTTNLTNTIIAGNQAPTTPDIQGSLATNIDNLLNMSAAAAGLGTLGDYGGPTQTIPLLAGSSAIDAGTSNGAPPTDQRGLPRNGPVDIGAYEYYAPTTVAAVQVNDSSAQRSEVRLITVTFSGPVAFAGGNAAAAFQLSHVQTGNNVILSAIASTDSQGRTVVTLGFSGGETDPVSAMNGGIPSLADGRYSLTIFSADVDGPFTQPLDGNADGMPGGDYVSPADTSQGNGLHLFRLFGDVNGDGAVNGTDLALFRSAYNTNSTNALYLSYLDADNSGAVDAQDLGQFRSRNNKNVFGP